MRKTKQNENMTHTHTPGPWEQLGCEIYAGEIPITGIIGMTWDRMMENQANIDLISAAPDLLAALEGLLSDKYLADPINADRMAKARAAIAKATGKGDA
jgi:hypothetical protein